MRCITCGEVMRLTHAVSDRDMMVSGYEHHTFECLGCHETERRLTFVTSQPSEPKPVAPLPAPPEPVPPPQELPPAPPSAWSQALAKLRARQAELQTRADLAKQAKAADRFNRDWDGLVPQRRVPIRRTGQAVASASGAAAPQVPIASPVKAPHQSTALERVAAKIRSYQAKRGITPENPHIFSRFDQFWEGLAPSGASLELRAAAQQPPSPSSTSLAPIEGGTPANGQAPKDK